MNKDEAEQRARKIAVEIIFKGPKIIPHETLEGPWEDLISEALLSFSQERAKPLVEALDKIDQQKMCDLSNDLIERSMQFAGLWTSLKFIASEALKIFNTAKSSQYLQDGPRLMYAKGFIEGWNARGKEDLELAKNHTCEDCQGTSKCNQCFQREILELNTDKP